MNLSCIVETLLQFSVRSGVGGVIMGRFGRLRCWAGAITWLLFVGGGFLLMLNHAFAPATAAASPPGLWPHSAPLPEIQGLPRLVMFMHPRCPCTRASVQQLRLIAEHSRRPLDILIVVLDSEKLPRNAMEGKSVREAADIRGAVVLRDRNGAAAAQFAAAASGHLVLYDPEGKLVYSGGITPSRGHAGETPASHAILSYLRSGRKTLPAGPVFGCPLFAPADLKEGQQCCPA